MKFKNFLPLVALVTFVGFAFAISPPPSQASADSRAPQSYSEYQNTRWHFSVFIPDDVVASEYDQRGGVTIQFNDPQGNELFQVSVWPYRDLDVALGEETPAGSASDQPDELGIVHAFHDDMFELAFVKNGVGYVVQSPPDNATSTLDILKSWQFI